MRHQVHELKSRQEEIAYVKFFARVIHTEPHVKACCACIRDACLSNSIKISESGKRLLPAFAETIRNNFTNFAADAITMFYMCGFVVYYVDTSGEMPMPRTLPLGSFTWGVERKSSKTAVWPFCLKVRGIDCSFDENKLHIFTRDVYSRNVVYSPMEGVVRTLEHYISIHESIANSACNNEKANVLVSENIDIKDQTLNGIQMLDDARQYMMKGSTPLQQYDLGVRLGGARTDTVNLEREHVLQYSNDRQKRIDLTSIPPNSQVTAVPMASPHVESLKETYRQYVLACNAYFGIEVAPPSADTEASGMKPTQNVRYMCDMLQDLIRQAYAECFKVDAAHVVVQMSRPKLDVMNVADVKVLFECGIFTPHELKKNFS
jgi:arginyl-tRNA--protein-N-Asp/Glu arginylyltransferase